MSKLTVTLPDELHAQIRQELEAQGITTGQFIEMVVTKYFTKSKEGENNMATRTIAFQVSEELYQRIKEYLNRYQEVYGRKLTQREFMLQLIEDALSEAENEFEAAAAAEEESPEQEEALDSEPDTEDADESDCRPRKRTRKEAMLPRRRWRNRASGRGKHCWRMARPLLWGRPGMLSENLLPVSANRTDARRKTRCMTNLIPSRGCIHQL